VKQRTLFVASMLVFGSLSAWGAAPATSAPATPAVSNPCEQVKEACSKAGFISGEVKEGKGLWADCIEPIMQGTTPPKGAVLKMPTVDAATVAACKAKDPRFGQPAPKKAP
jgi:hypothetical protein